jgi:hypothetical protein
MRLQRWSDGMAASNTRAHSNDHSYTITLTTVITNIPRPLRFRQLNYWKFELTYSQIEQIHSNSLNHLRDPEKYGSFDKSPEIISGRTVPDPDLLAKEAMLRYCAQQKIAGSGRASASEQVSAVATV